MKRINYVIFLSLLFVFACEWNDGKIMEKKPTVCISDGVPVKEAPSKEGKFITSLNLGETVTFLGQIVIDSLDDNKEYLNIEMSDGKEAWANSYGLVVDSKIAVIRENAIIYKRPDLTTITKKEFLKMDVVAVAAKKDGWINVIGEKKKMEGWIKMDLVTESMEDVAFSILVSKELKQKDGNLKIDGIEQFIEESPFQNSIFISYLKEILVESRTGKEMVIKKLVPKNPVLEDTVSEEMHKEDSLRAL